MTQDRYDLDFTIGETPGDVWADGLEDRFDALSVDVTNSVGSFNDLPAPADVQQSENGQWPVFVVTDIPLVVRVTDETEQIIGGLGSESQRLPKQWMEAVDTEALAAVELEDGSLEDQVSVTQLAAALGTTSENRVPGTTHFEESSHEALEAEALSTESLETNLEDGEDVSEDRSLDTTIQNDRDHDIVVFYQSNTLGSGQDGEVIFSVSESSTDIGPTENRVERKRADGDTHIDRVSSSIHVPAGHHYELDARGDINGASTWAERGVIAND